MSNVINWRSNKLNFGSSTVGRTYVETRSYTRDRTLLCGRHLYIQKYIKVYVRVSCVIGIHVYIYIRICFSVFKVYIYSGTVQRIVYYAYNPVVIEGIFVPVSAISFKLARNWIHPLSTASPKYALRDCGPLTRCSGNNYTRN